MEAVLKEMVQVSREKQALVDRLQQGLVDRLQQGLVDNLKGGVDILKGGMDRLLKGGAAESSASLKQGGQAELLAAMEELERTKMSRPKVDILDGCLPAYGLQLPERLFIEALVMRRDISHPPGWDTGRPSQPAYMDMNLQATRGGGWPAAVVWQYDCKQPMNPRGLLMAYEEEGVVTPVVSDMDALLVASKGISFSPLDAAQVCLPTAALYT